MSLLFKAIGPFKKEELDLYRRFLESNECISSKGLPEYWHRYKSCVFGNHCYNEVTKRIGMMFPDRVFVGFIEHNEGYDIIVFKNDTCHIIFDHLQRLSKAVFYLNIFHIEDNESATDIFDEPNDESCENAGLPF